MKPITLTLVAAALLMATAASAQSIAVAPCGTVVAHDRVVELIGCQTAKWKTEGVSHDGPIALDEQRVAVLDSIANVARVIDLATGKATTLKTGETPTGGALIGGKLFVLARDARQLERIGADGTRISIPVGADAQLRVHNGLLYVYSRIEGRMQEITPEPFAVVRTLEVPPFASDFAVDTKFLYFIYPSDGMLRTYSLETLASAGEGTLGEAPMDIELATKPNLITSRVLAIADPTARRVWMIEGSQSTTKAVLRGMLRGLLGVGTYAGSSREFPIGVDRLVASDNSAVAYDSSSGSLYQILPKKKTRLLATLVAPRAFAVTDELAYWWDGRALQSAPF